MPDLGHIWNLVDKGGTLAFAIFVVVALAKGWFVPRWAYLELKERFDTLSKVSEQLADLGEKNARASEELKTRCNDCERERERLQRVVEERSNRDDNRARR